MTAAFARLQRAENSLMAGLVDTVGVDWILELAPVHSPSPIIHVPRHRMLLGEDGWVWPFRCLPAELPFADEDLPAIMIRHMFWLPTGTSILRDALRCLKPGGLLISVSANPWHRLSWNELGRAAFRLPAWPRFLMQHAGLGLQLQIPVRYHWTGVLPGVSPVLMVVARKPARAIRIRRPDFSRKHISIGTAPASGCRAA
ncbi:MAG: class I SAM-dependent methyltransferase [Xanthomonadaceae bacterium]|nr:class I SAM-dependent methyltransferase [Xanthomonadaceae bacterium]